MDKDVEMKDSTKNKDNKKDKPLSKEEEQKKKEEERKQFIEKSVAEVENLPLDQIRQKIKALEGKTSIFKGEINKMKVDIKKFRQE